MGIEKISSLHDDVLVPEKTGHLGEYDSYPNRMDPKDKSVITRIGQFGIDPKDVEEMYGKKINELTEDEYDALMAESIKGRYDTIVASVFDQYMFPSPESPDDETRMKKMLQVLKQFEGMEANFGVNIIRSKEDFKESGNLVLSLEAGAHLIKSVTDARKLADRGIKIFGLQYGSDNTIVEGSALTGLGRDVVKDLLDKNLIIDLAHTVKQPRQEVMEIAKELNKGHLISYTHGCAVEDLIESWHDKFKNRAARMLTQDEIKELVKMKSIIGLSVSKPFFENTQKVAERIDSIAQLDGGINSVAIGTDFGGVAPEWLNEIKSPEDFKILGDILSRNFGMKDEDIEKVIRSNAKSWIKKAIN